MQLTVKTLKGGKFTIEVEPSNTVAEAKAVIETTRSELPAATMKLIHSGKVLKDDATIESCNIKPTDFLVVMIAKAKKAAAAAPKPAAAAAPKEEAKPAAAAAAASTEAAAPATAATAAPSATTESAPPPSATTTTTNESNDDEFPAEVINNLKALGFPESDCRACLRASHGNPDVAVEFLMNGIPPRISAAGGAAAATGTTPSTTTTAGAAGSGALEALRHHPQFNDLKRLVQTNPNMLSAVLQQIGQQQPELLQAINANQAEFLQMMNEPVASGSEGGTTAAPPAPSSSSNNNPFGGGGGSSSGGMPPGMEALGNPAQLAAMLQSMPPQEQQAMASMMGMTVDQLQQTAQMISAMPQEQMQQYMNMAMQGAGGAGGPMGGMMGGAGGGGGAGAGAQVLRLSEEEMAAVNRLTEMGFDRAAAAQAYLACDKNEALAANLLMDGGFADFGDDGADMGGGGGGGGDDDMYD